VWPFKKTPEPPKTLRRLQDLEVRMTDQEDGLEKLLHQQSRIIGKMNKRHQMALKELEDDAPPDGNGASVTVPPQEELQFNRDPKAALRARARELRGMRR